MWLALCWKSVQILLYGYTLVDFLPKFLRRVGQNAKKSLEDLQRAQAAKEENLTGTHGGEYSKVFEATETKDNETNIAHVAVCKSKLNSLSASQKASTQRQGESISLRWDKEAREYDQGSKESREISNNSPCRRRTIVTEIAKRFEENDFNVKVHTASLSQTVSDVYFEGARVSTEINDQNSSLKSNAFSSNFPCSASGDEREGVHDEFTENTHNTVSTNDGSTSTCNTSQANNNSHSSQFGYCSNHNGHENLDLQFENCIYTNNSTEDQNDRGPKRRLHSPVDTFEDILRQQRFSRSFSTYSITDLLTDCPSDADVDNYINNINK